MAQIAILKRKCDGCGECARACPFGAIDMISGAPELNAACKVCGACVRACKKQAIVRLETKAASVDKSKWKGFLVLAETSGGRLHPVSLELLGEAKRLAAGTNHPVRAAVIGHHVRECAQVMASYGAEEVYLYDAEELSFFRADAFADCMEDAIKTLSPSVVLVGATALGRSLAPRLSARFHTGLTADCTKLEFRESSDLVQIRPAFGGNIMAQIVTSHTRPQFATVRYKVMSAPGKSERTGEIIDRKIPKIKSPVLHISTLPVPKSANISDADILVAGGRGLRRESDLGMIKELAALLGGEWATSRPLVEKGWNTNLRQIGLSGRTVRPKLLIACGISGAIQFTACMSAAEHIIAINSDPDAPIFKVAHVAVVGDLYEILPRVIARLKEEKR